MDPPDGRSVSGRKQEPFGFALPPEEKAMAIPGENDFAPVDLAPGLVSMNPLPSADIRILVVESDRGVREGVLRLFQDAGYDAQGAADADEALRNVAESRPDLVLLNRDLPGAEGLALCGRLKESSANAAIFVVLISGSYVQTEHQAEGLEAGADGYIAQPIADRELLARVGAFARIIHVRRELHAKQEELAQSVAAGQAAQLASLNLAEDAIAARERMEALNAELRRENAERQRVEHRLRQLSRIVEQAPISIAITNLQGALEYANPTFCAVSGYSLEELLGRNPRILKSGQTPPEIYEEMWRTVIRGEVWRGEMRNRKKDGTLYDETVIVAPVADETGKVTHFVSLKEDVTDKKRAEEALRDSERRYRELFNLESDAILLMEVESGRIIEANQAAVAMYGYPQEDLLRLRNVDLSAEPEKTRELTRNAAPRSHVIVPLRRHRRSDGTEFPVEITMRFFQHNRQDLYVAAIRDITEQVQAREALVRFNAELEEKVARRTAELAARNREVQGLLQAIPDVVLRLRPDGSVLYTQSAPGTGGLTALVGAAEGRATAEVAPELLAPSLAFGRQALAKQGVVTGETEIALDEIRIAVELRAAPMGSQEFVVFVRDITTRKRLEAETAALLERERQVSDMKTRFISVTSHEFRTPMSAAMGSAELLHNHYERLAPAKREELFARIALSLRRMTEMLDDVLTLNRIDAKRVDVRLVLADLRLFVQNVVEETRIADRDAHRFAVDLPPAATPFVTDTHLLHHILGNLLSNAVRYSPQGTVISVQVSVVAQQAWIRVQDQGIGIPEADRTRIFEPFERGSNVGQIKGTGLGLNIVKRMTELLGGTVAVEAPEGGGTRFVLSFPALPLPGSPS